MRYLAFVGDVNRGRTLEGCRLLVCSKSLFSERYPSDFADFVFDTKFEMLKRIIIFVLNILRSVDDKDDTGQNFESFLLEKRSFLGSMISFVFKLSRVVSCHVSGGRL